jgi:hypothetical protein
LHIRLVKEPPNQHLGSWRSLWKAIMSMINIYELVIYKFILLTFHYLFNLTQTSSIIDWPPNQPSNSMTKSNFA